MTFKPFCCGRKPILHSSTAFLQTQRHKFAFNLALFPSQIFWQAPFFNFCNSDINNSERPCYFCGTETPSFPNICKCKRSFQIFPKNFYILRGCCSSNVKHLSQMSNVIFPPHSNSLHFISPSLLFLAHIAFIMTILSVTFERFTSLVLVPRRQFFTDREPAFVL